MFNYYCINSRFLSLSCKRTTPYGAAKVMRSKKTNGMKVAGAKPLGAQIAACTVMYQAGSRYENSDQLGASHFLRVGSNGAGVNFTSFIKTRCLQQHGAYITCSSDRQTIAFTLRCPPPFFKNMKDILADVTKNFYHHWEVDDRRPVVHGDLTRASLEERAMDLIQKASFYGPLSNSVFCNKNRVENISAKDVQKFKIANFRSNLCSVASVGVPYEETMRMADDIEDKYELKSTDRETGQSRYRSGYECLNLGDGSDTCIALAVPGCNMMNLDELLMHAILAESCGTGNIQKGQHKLDRTPQAPLGSLSGDVFTNYRAFNISHIDLGIFGILVKTRSSSAKAVAFQATEFMTKLGNCLTREDIMVGKERLKINLVIHEQDCVKYAEGLAMQLISGAQFSDASELACTIDCIRPEDVLVLAYGLSQKAKAMSIAVVGDVNATPLDIDLLGS